MLGDDIMEGTVKGVKMLGHAAKNVAKGALLFAAVAAGAALIYAVAVSFPVGGIAGLFAAGPTGGFAGSFFGELAAHAGVIGNWALSGAVFGGIATGLASLMPGKGEGFSLGQFFRKGASTASHMFTREPSEARVPDREPTPPVSPSPATSNSPQQNTIMVNTTPDNHLFVPGRGAEMLKKGNECETSLAK